MPNSINSKYSFMTPAVKQRRPTNTSTAMKSTRPSTSFADPANCLSPIASDEKESKSDSFEVEKAYNKYMKALLADILVDEVTEREVTEIDWKIAELAKRFEMNKSLLEATNRRLKDISFQAEHQRLQDLRSMDVSSFLEYTDSDDPNPDLSDFTEKQKAYLNQMKLENVIIGDNAKDGVKELHDTIVDTISAFEDIKKNAKLTDDEFKKYSTMGDRIVEGMEENGEIDDIRKEVESMLPAISADVLTEVSESLHRLKLISNENEDDDDDDNETAAHNYD